MKLSIAMATYNGATYLKEQLDSFAAQTRLPDELIVCDDGSSDDTVEILQSFARNCPFRVEVVRNKTNLGYTRNFEKAFSLCQGDVIFISDQDDVWFENKIEYIENIFLIDYKVMVVINDQEITDQNLHKSGRTIFSNTRAIGFDESWLSAGCCTAIRSVFKNMLLPFPEKLMAYDGWIHQVACTLGVRKVVPEILQYYRRHSFNTSDSMASTCLKPSLLDPIRLYGLQNVTPGWLRQIEVSSFMLKMFDSKKQELSSLGLTNQAELIFLSENIKNNAITDRIEMIKYHRHIRLFKVIKFYLEGKYNFFSGWKSALKDAIR